MASEPQRMENCLGSRMVFQDEAMRFSRTGGDHTAARKPRAGASAAGFVMDDDKMFSDDHHDGHRFVRPQESDIRRGLYGSPPNPSWNVNGDTRSPSGDGSDGDEEEDDDEDEDDDDDDLDEGDGEVDGLVSVEGNIKNNNNSSSSVHSSSEKIHSEKANIREHHSSFGLSRGVMAKDGHEMRGSLNEQQHRHERAGSYANAITVVEPELYRTQILHEGDGPNPSHKEMGGENAYGFGGTKGLSIDPGESLRMHLSDPITGDLMDNAIILPCGHSFGSGGMQHVIRTKACCKCSQPISEDLVRPNLALCAAVQVFRREEELRSLKASKRRRDRFEQDKGSHDDPFAMDSRGKGVQFPFVVSDRVIIKGNKRTPQRFVGRVAVVTTQCLNGWYVVKTLDNAESVKLQYRSLAKVTDGSSPSMIPNKSVSPNWPLYA